MALSDTILKDLVNTELAQYYIEVPQYDDNGNRLTDRKIYIFSDQNSELKNNGSPVGDNVLKVLAEVLCEKIIQHITTAAVVNSTVVVTNVSGVTTGPSVSGPGAGTATGTIS